MSEQNHNEIGAIGGAYLIELPCHRRDDGEVVVAEAATQIPFVAARMFTLTAPVGAQRGKHAHRLCSQFMVCVTGGVEVVCENGRKQRSFALDRANLALMVPPGIWNTVIFRRTDSVLIVLCDRLYEADDYIRDYAEFLSFRASV
jgi:dTDP-4-dehydrorhamnose 3,5-epimerase-like enzyme